MTYSAHLDEAPVELDVGADSLRVGSRGIPYVDLDAVEVDGWSVTLRLAAGDAVTVTHLGRGRDTFLGDLRARRLAARRAALLLWTGDAPLGVFETAGDEPVVLTVFPDGVTVESDAGPALGFPLGITVVERDGYRIRLTLPGREAVSVGLFGRSTDTVLDTMSSARRALGERTAAAYRALDDRLAGFAAPDGWAVDAASAGHWWGALSDAAGSAGRAEEVAVLAALAGERLRVGVKADAHGGSIPFVLAPVGELVAVEAVAADDRATFVFAATSVEELNLALLLTSFRREAVALADHELGRWALAVRAVPEVRWLRGALIERVVHNSSWADTVTRALGAPSTSL